MKLDSRASVYFPGSLLVINSVVNFVIRDLVKQREVANCRLA